MNTAGCCQIIRLFDQAFVPHKTATAVLRSLWTEIASNEDLYVNRASFEMSKSISQIKSLHNHVITIILTPANGECTLRKQYL